MEKIQENYIRVTDVLSVFSGLNNIPEHILQNACRRGTDVHHIIDGLIAGYGCQEIPEEIVGYIDSFRLWFDDFEGCEFETPDRFFDPELMLTGKCDLILTDGKRTLIDFKTSAKFSKTWPFQLSAYNYLIDHSNECPVSEAKIVMLNKSGEEAQIFSYSSYELYQEIWPMFKSALALYKHFK